MLYIRHLTAKINTMRILTILFTCVILITLSACGGDSSTKSNDQTTKTPQSIKVDQASLATMKDVVCGMSMKGIAIADTAVVNGKVYTFCAKPCKEIFVKDKEKYVLN